MEEIPRKDINKDRWIFVGKHKRKEAKKNAQVVREAKTEGNN